MNLELTDVAKQAALDGPPLVVDGSLRADSVYVTHDGHGGYTVELYNGETPVARVQSPPLVTSDQLRLYGLDIRVPLKVQ